MLAHLCVLGPDNEQRKMGRPCVSASLRIDGPSLYLWSSKEVAQESIRYYNATGEWRAPMFLRVIRDRTASLASHWIAHPGGQCLIVL